MHKYIVKVNDNGTRFWYDETGKKLHRLDGPAVEYADGYQAWFLHGKLHRVDGPAREFSNGDKEWYLEGVKYSQEDWEKKVNPPKDPCKGKVVEIDGVKYQLTPIGN